MQNQVFQDFQQKFSYNQIPTVCQMNVFSTFYDFDSSEVQDNQIEDHQKKNISTNDVFDKSVIGEKDQEDNSDAQEFDPLEMQDNSLEEVLIEILNPTLPKESPIRPRDISKEKKINKKNSNAIKKYGRMIIPRINLYKVNGTLNQGMKKMMEMLEQKKKEKKTLKDKKDGFNTSHLKTMFNSCSAEEASHNLKITRKIFSSTLRKEVFESIQIPEDNQVLYLNTLKCAALRFSSKSLALRLQLSQNP